MQAPFSSPLGRNKCFDICMISVLDLLRSAAALAFWMIVILFYNELDYIPQPVSYVIPVVVLGVLLVVLLLYKKYRYDLPAELQE